MNKYNNLLKTPIRRYPALSDWEVLDLYAERHKLSANEEHAIRAEVDFRAERSCWFAEEATRR